MSLDSTIIIAVWLCIWFLGMGWFWLARKYYGLSYAQSYIVAPVYAGFAFLVLSLIPDTAPLIASLSFTSLQAYTLYSIVALALVVYSIVDHRKELRGGGTGVMGGVNHTLSKVAELFFQQSCMLVLASIALEISSSPSHALDLFTTVFLLIHFPLVGILPRFWSLYFIAFSLVGGFLFGALILLMPPNGWLLSIAVHHMFYIATSWYAFREHPQVEIATKKE